MDLFAGAPIIAWLRLQDPQRLNALWDAADAVRRRHVGQSVHLRVLVEISNHCDRECFYCGLRLPNLGLPRYRVSESQVLEVGRQAARLGYGTMVLQAGEDPGLEADWVSDLIRQIKAETELGVTLSLGERAEAELQQFRDAGADRYLLRFETSNRELYERIHPPPASGPRQDRIALLRSLREMGYEVGSGVMVGIPGQSHTDLARDIELFRELDLDMIGLGPNIPHPDTPLPSIADSLRTEISDPAPADGFTAYKMLALARLVCPRANIPATTALATLDPASGLALGLRRGANVVMPNWTPVQYRGDYAIYPGKAGSTGTPAYSHRRAVELLAALGRPVGCGRGDSPNMRQRRDPQSHTDAV